MTNKIVNFVCADADEISNVAKLLTDAGYTAVNGTPLSVELNEDITNGVINPWKSVEGKPVEFSLLSHEAVRTYLFTQAQQGCKIEIKSDIIDQIRYNGINVEMDVYIDDVRIDTMDLDDATGTGLDDWNDAICDVVGEHMDGDHCGYVGHAFIPFLIPSNPTDEMLAFFMLPNVSLSFFNEATREQVFKSQEAFEAFKQNGLPINSYEYNVQEGYDS